MISMKSYIFGFACLLASATNSFAQEAEESHEMAIHNYHDATGSEFILGHGFLPSEQLFNGNHRRLGYTTDQYSGAIFATYRYHISEVVSLGLAFAYEYENGSYTDNTYNYNYFSGSGGVVPGYYNNYGTFARSSFTIAPEITFTYANFGRGLVHLYSVVGLGYTFRDEVLTDGQTNAEFTSPYINRVHANAYVSPFGMRIGGRLNGFFELGLGYKGVFNYGVTYRL